MQLLNRYRHDLLAHPDFLEAHLPNIQKKSARVVEKILAEHGSMVIGEENLLLYHPILITKN